MGREWEGMGGELGVGVDGGGGGGGGGGGAQLSSAMSMRD